MNRKQKLLCHIDKRGAGLEIGPSFNPTAPKSEGYNVRILDHLSREDLIEKYRSQLSAVENIEPVDYVWHGEPYSTLIGSDAKFDWIIASHVIEHTPDLIAFLNNCASVLKEGGTLSLAIPDKRYCFDYFRPPSSLAHVIDANTFKLTKPSRGMIADSKLNAVSRGGTYVWDPYLLGKLAFASTSAHARRELDQALSSEEYVDVHSWSFTPNSFRLLIHDLHSLGLISLQEIAFFPTAGYEFVIVLTMGENTKTPDRMTLAKKAQADLAPTFTHYLFCSILSLASMPLRYIWHKIRRSN